MFLRDFPSYKSWYGGGEKTDFVFPKILFNYKKTDRKDNYFHITFCLVVGILQNVLSSVYILVEYTQLCFNYVYFIKCCQCVIFR